MSPPAQAEPDDATLLAAHAAGDPMAFTTLLQRHRDRLWAVAMRTLDGDREEAADALQEALIRAMRHAGSFRGDAAVTTWLHRIVVNTCIDRIRRRTSRPAEALGERDLPSPRDEMAVAEARLMVREALARLPEDQRDAIVLVDLMDLSVAEAAERLGVPVGTVKSRCSRGRTALAVILREGLARQGEAQHMAPSGNSTRTRRVEAHGPQDPGPPRSASVVHPEQTGSMRRATSSEEVTP